MTQSDAELSIAYSSIDCFVHAAGIGESFGLVLTEAMLCGCPVVTVSRPHKDNSQVEVVGHKTGGIVAGSIRSLPAAVISLHDDATLLALLSARARQTVIDRFAVDTVAATSLRAMQISLENPERSKLLQRLQDEPSFITDVDAREMLQSLQNAVGKPDISELIQMRLIHNPAIQRIYNYVYRKLHR